MALRGGLSRSLRSIYSRRLIYSWCEDLRALNANFASSTGGCSGLELGLWARYRQYCFPRRGYFKEPCSHFMHPTSVQPFSTTTADNAHKEEGNQKETISVTFVDKDGEENVVQVPIGMSMLEAAHENDIELEGACEGSLACSTCHVIVMDVDYYNKLEEPTDEENDMLDLAFGLTETSRLGCQVIARPELDGMRLALPAATRNFAVDGYVPKPH